MAVLSLSSAVVAAGSAFVMLGSVVPSGSFVTEMASLVFVMGVALSTLAIMVIDD